ncbi:MAG: class I SAM-dependent methyltransferase [Candidatus Bathyarchaeota archaeon]|nr:MAG: class I SAM-dependent methyltransferase [Candidatus Bathyarchaeota archaeon]
MDEWRKKRQAMLHYDRIALGYDDQYAKEQNVKMEAASKNVVLEENNITLDMGCGTGLLFPHLADKTKLFVGIDISRKLLREAQKRAKQHPNIALVQADADHTPFNDQAFHSVFAITLLQNMPNPTATLKEIDRVTTPEATIILTILKKSFTQKAMSGLLEKVKLRITAQETMIEVKDHIVACQKQARAHALILTLLNV